MVELGIPEQEKKSKSSNNVFADRDPEGIYIAYNQALNIAKIMRKLGKAKEFNSLIKNNHLGCHSEL